MSRVCIVVLEEVEDDDPSPLHSKAAPDHISQNSSQDEKPSLIKAIFNSDADEVRSLIFKKEDVNVQMVQLLVSRGANINAFDKKDRRAVHWAAYMGHLEVMKLLVSHGAEVCCKDKKSYSPLHAAASSGMINVVKYLLHLGVD
ncbi:hypothetical protein cypCar_00047774, partial [Cyprinus carpio]